MIFLIGDAAQSLPTLQSPPQQKTSDLVLVSFPYVDLTPHTVEQEFVLKSSCERLLVPFSRAQFRVTLSIKPKSVNNFSSQLGNRNLAELLSRIARASFA